MADRGAETFDAGRIRAVMSPAARERLRDFSVLEETDSTNSHLRRLPESEKHAHAVLAECQTGGRGRRRRNWYSPPGGNIYLSLGWRFGGGDLALSLLPLVVAICVCRTLARVGLTGVGIKWPNDILAGGRKLAGILVEVQSAGAGPALAVIGIGLNVRMPGAQAVEAGGLIDRPWTDLESQAPEGADLDRNRITAGLLEELLSALAQFEASGFDTFTQEWGELDLLRGRKTLLEHDGQVLEGIARGIDAHGGLLLERDGGRVQAYHSGEVSTRRD